MNHVTFPADGERHSAIVVSPPEHVIASHLPMRALPVPAETLPVHGGATRGSLATAARSENPGIFR